MDSYNVDDSYNGEDFLPTDHTSDGMGVSSMDNGQMPEVHVGDHSHSEIASTDDSLGVANNGNLLSEVSHNPFNHGVYEKQGGDDFQSQLDNIMKPHNDSPLGLTNKSETDYNESLSDIKNQSDFGSHQKSIDPKQDGSSQISFGCTGCATKCLHTCSGACFTSCSGSCDGSSAGR